MITDEHPTIVDDIKPLGLITWPFIVAEFVPDDGSAPVPCYVVAVDVVAAAAIVVMADSGMGVTTAPFGRGDMRRIRTSDLRVLLGVSS